METSNNYLFAISPVDGRYRAQTESLNFLVSEFALIRNRLLIEINWLIKLASEPKITNLKPITKNSIKFLQNLIANFSLKDAAEIKKIEIKINHDVKSIEYFLKNKIKNHIELSQFSEFIHFALTSEDVNNLAYALMIKSTINDILNPEMQLLILQLRTMAHKYATIPMLARTHGQPATPTTMGKELANFVARLENQLIQFKKIIFKGKFSGAVGNFNAHFIAIANFPWEQFCTDFVKELGLEFNLYTTQIEPHDYIAEICHSFIRFNNILLDLNRDIWEYIALNYFTQKLNAMEVGSSTMPHKINPIDFENSEGNLGIANCLFEHFANKLPISRLQRDLSDSTVMRNIGTSFAHTLLAYKSLSKGLAKLEINSAILKNELNQHYEVLGEAIQTLMRLHGIDKPYEKLKEFLRSQKIDENKLRQFIDNLNLPEAEKKRLRNLKPENYLGIAVKLAKKI